MEQEGRPFDGERFRALARHLASRSQADAAFDRAKLANLLHHCDFLAYAELGDSITGAIYTKSAEGPWPERLDALDRLEGAGEDADTDMFTAAEVAIIEQALRMLRDRDASGNEPPTHIEALSQYVDDGEVIAYNLVFISTEPPSPEAIRAAQEVAERLGRVARAG
ncbi:MAG: hypothetical protein F4081_01345 [Dehalococcoidia bacterium]|nr:hypothetical protein [Dehalococcoidia bacterium]MYI85446.1 hypothetical protein [Dehalococcoidia bacterium]